MVDALILARCEAVVGQFKSHLSRLFWELAIDTQMRVVPYVSLDRSSWCWFNWGSNTHEGLSDVFILADRG